MLLKLHHSLALIPPCALLCAPAARADTNPDAGKAEGRCRADEPGPALIVDVVGLKDRKGLVKLEVYPSADGDFLGDDNRLLREGKVFRRVEVPTPGAGAVTLCVRVPEPGAYSVSLLHDREGTHKFHMMSDGIGFGGNPHLGWRKPTAAEARVRAGNGLTHISIILNYRHGFGMSPEKGAR